LFYISKLCNKCLHVAIREDGLLCCKHNYIVISELDITSCCKFVDGPTGFAEFLPWDVYFLDHPTIRVEIRKEKM
jgi:hypothetical protein